MHTMKALVDIGATINSKDNKGVGIILNNDGRLWCSLSFELARLPVSSIYHSCIDGVKRGDYLVTTDYNVIASTVWLLN